MLIIVELYFFFFSLTYILSVNNYSLYKLLISHQNEVALKLFCIKFLILKKIMKTDKTNYCEFYSLL
jgi:hypothetical protein